MTWKNCQLRATLLRLVLVAGNICLFSNTAIAGWPCSLSHAYPEISNLTVLDGSVVATLGDYFRTDRDSPIVLRQLENGGWAISDDEHAVTKTTTLSACDGQMTPPLDEYWLRTRKDFDRTKDYFEQEIGACTTDGAALWGGTSFYGGEGYWGVGALIRKDLESGEYRYYQDLHLQPYSTSHLAYFARKLWIGTTHHGECSGPEPGFGVMRFDLRHEVAVRKAPEICGFAVRSMIVHDDKLWIATDLGLSIGQALPNGDVEWQNYLPDLDDELLMRPVECDALYEELLRSPRIVTDTAFDMGYAFEDLWARLYDLRPEFVTQYLRKLHNHPEWERPSY